MPVRVNHQWVGNVKPGPLVNDRLMYMKVDPALRAARIAEWNRPIWWPVVALALLLVVAVIPAWRGWLATSRTRDRGAHSGHGRGRRVMRRRQHVAPAEAGAQIPVRVPRCCTLGPGLRRGGESRMLNYIVRRIGYAVLILVGVNLLTLAPVLPRSIRPTTSRA